MAIGTFREFLSLGEGQEAEFIGSVAAEVWQHPVVLMEDYPHVFYFDLDGGQAVAYCRGEPPAYGKILLRGRIASIRAESKRPGSEDYFYVKQILCDSWTTA
jgi:hypothetical protein